MTCFTDPEPVTLVPLHLATRPLSSPPVKDGTVALKDTINDDLTVAQKEYLLVMLQKHRILFDVHSKLFGRTSVPVHRIETDGSSIVTPPPIPRVFHGAENHRGKRPRHAQTRHYPAVIKLLVVACCASPEAGRFCTILRRL